MVPLESVTEEHFHKHFDLNVLGVLLTSRGAFNYFDPNAAVEKEKSKFVGFLQSIRF